MAIYTINQEIEEPVGRVVVGYKAESRKQKEVVKNELQKLARYYHCNMETEFPWAIAFPNRVWE